MLKTNSKKARLNVRAYALQSVSFDDYGYNDITDAAAKENWQTFAKTLTKVIKSEKAHDVARWYGCITPAIFKDWLQGLPFSIGDYFYNVSAVELLGDILEETQEERSRYTEEQAEERLTIMLYREIVNCNLGQQI